MYNSRLFFGLILVFRIVFIILSVLFFHISFIVQVLIVTALFTYPRRYRFIPFIIDIMITALLRTCSGTLRPGWSGGWQRRRRNRRGSWVSRRIDMHAVQRACSSLFF
ncbi:hypothetical protein JOM56_005454, partial [Amanita muscaria]